MNQEKLFSLMPTEIIKKEDMDKKMEEQKEIIKAGKSYVSLLSMNRFLNKRLSDFDIEERLNLFSDLTYADFVYDENALYSYEIDMDSFAYLLEERFNLDAGDMYELDNVYIENLLNGKDITKETVNMNDENMSFQAVLERFVFKTSGMSMGDTPNLMKMLAVKKALLGSYFAEKNVESLQNGQTEIYDISVLM